MVAKFRRVEGSIRWHTRIGACVRVYAWPTYLYAISSCVVIYAEIDTSLKSIPLVTTTPPHLLSGCPVVEGCSIYPRRKRVVSCSLIIEVRPDGVASCHALDGEAVTNPADKAARSNNWNDHSLAIQAERECLDQYPLKLQNERGQQEKLEKSDDPSSTLLWQ